MSYSESQQHCPSCQHNVLARREEPNRAAILLFGFFTLGLVWLVGLFLRAGPWLCTSCGTTISPPTDSKQGPSSKGCLVVLAVLIGLSLLVQLLEQTLASHSVPTPTQKAPTQNPALPSLITNLSALAPAQLNNMPRRIVKPPSFVDPSALTGVLVNYGEYLSLIVNEHEEELDGSPSIRTTLGKDKAFFYADSDALRTSLGWNSQGRSFTLFLVGPGTRKGKLKVLMDSGKAVHRHVLENAK